MDNHRIARLECRTNADAPGAFASGCVLSRGKHTWKVPLTLHAANRAKLVAAMHEAQATFLFRGGISRCRDDTDHEELFRQESFFRYLFGVKEPDWYGCVDSSGEARLFAPKLPAEYAVWMGKILTLEAWTKMYGVQVLWVDDMKQYLEGKRVLAMTGVNSDSGADINEALPIDGAELSSSLYHVLSECRVIKSDAEIDVMRYASYATSQAHVAVMRSAKPGDYEYQLEARFLARIAEDHGCRTCAYTSICACGPNSAVLHYGHAAAPNARLLLEDDMALLDMGAEYHYCSDITCSFPVRGTFDDNQRLIYEAVLSAQENVMTSMRPGVSWADMHVVAERTILHALVDGGVLKGDVDDMFKVNLGAVFLPCGLGHLIGIDTHDVGGYLDGHPPRGKRAGLNKLRTARILEQGMCLTVEPGCYFIDALLDVALADPATAPFFNVPRLDEFRQFGGVRLEDVVVVTNDGIVNLTLCPRTTAEIESVMANGPWPPLYDEAPWLKRDWCAYDADGQLCKLTVEVPMR